MNKLLISFLSLAIFSNVGYADYSIKNIRFEKTPVFKETLQKLNIAKTIFKDQCFDADAGTPFASQNYTITSDKRKWISGWGCTNTDGSATDLAAIYVDTIANIGYLSNTRMMLVALDQNHNQIDTDAANIATRYATHWCLKLIDNDTTDGITVTNNIDFDADTDTDITFEQIIGYKLC